MIRLAAALALVCALAFPVLAGGDGIRPDPVLTPGAVRTTDRAAICSRNTREFRRVTVLEKVAARRAYGLASEFDGYCGNRDINGKRGCEIDHSLPLLVGGGNPPGSIKNLWPQRPDGPFSYHVKDRCEVKVGRSLCAGKISVEQAQAVFLGDWRVNCKPWLLDLPDIQ